MDGGFFSLRERHRLIGLYVMCQGGAPNVFLSLFVFLDPVRGLLSTSCLVLRANTVLHYTMRCECPPCVFHQVRLFLDIPPSPYHMACNSADRAPRAVSAVVNLVRAGIDIDPLSFPPPFQLRVTLLSNARIRIGCGGSF